MNYADRLNKKEYSPVMVVGLIPHSVRAMTFAPSGPNLLPENPSCQMKLAHGSRKRLIHMSQNGHNKDTRSKRDELNKYAHGMLNREAFPSHKHDMLNRECNKYGTPKKERAIPIDRKVTDHFRCHVQ